MLLNAPGVEDESGEWAKRMYMLRNKAYIDATLAASLEDGFRRQLRHPRAHYYHSRCSILCSSAFSSSAHSPESLLGKEFQCICYRRGLCRRGTSIVAFFTQRLNHRVCQLIVSLIFCVKRRFAVRLRLQRISKAHRTIGRGDVPQVSRVHGMPWAT